ncbi:DUF4145 domain-containing protein [Micromonospora sp. KC723]|nr:DUF4145 domain-containing protein [Micromonospora sp. KC723]
MVRRTLEGICRDNGIEDRNLASALVKMEEEGLIDRTIAQWAKHLRLLGNQGAHFTGSPISREDANGALTFTEALLDQIYVLIKRFDEFKQRREARASQGVSDKRLSVLAGTLVPCRVFSCSRMPSGR